VGRALAASGAQRSADAWRRPAARCWSASASGLHSPPLTLVPAKIRLAEQHPAATQRRYCSRVADGWSTDEELVAARERFAARVDGYVPPVAYALARRDVGGLVFGHVSRLGEARGLPAAALATVCGYSRCSGTYEIGVPELAALLRQLAPAEAATHVPHPNIWSWRELLRDARSDASFAAFYWADPADEPESDEEAEFYALAGVGGS
jgi:hypothetical protein